MEQVSYEQLVEAMAERGVVPGQMFGKPTLKVGSKAIACRYAEGVAFKLGLGSGEHSDALGLAGAGLFDPSGTGRPMKDWVWIPGAHSSRWPDFGEAARRKLG
jgi:hypothetical protein